MEDTLPCISDSAHKWSVAETNYDDAPLFIRFNVTAEQWIGHTELPIKLGFAIPFKASGKHGLPNPDENEALDVVEDLIISHLSAQTRGIHALVLTTGKMKELVFYIPHNVDVQAILGSIQQSTPE